MKTQRRTPGMAYFAWLCLAWGCAVYDAALLGADGGASSSGAGGVSGTASTSAGSAHDRGGAAGAREDGGVGHGAAGDPATAGQGGDAGAAGGESEGGAAAAGAPASSGGGAPECVSETTPAFCARLGKNCGLVDGVDNCGDAVVGANCGTCPLFKTCGGGEVESVCGSLSGPTAGGVAKASSVGTNAGEDAAKAFDANAQTKWYSGDNVKTGWLAYQFAASTAHVARSYSLTTANDIPARDPSAWQFQGSNDSATWVTLDQRTAEVFASRFQTKSYSCANSTAYRSYRLLVTANSGATALQLSELVLYSN